MNTLYFISLVSSTILACSGFDTFESFSEQSRICFETIHDKGCNTSLPEVFDPPFKGENINPANTKVYLFTVKNKKKAEPLHRCGGRLPAESEFDPSMETVLLVHGFLDGVCRTAWMREMRNQFFIRGDYNVILVDWTWGNMFDLNAGGQNAVVVGEQIAFILKNIVDEKKSTGKKFHLIGHSLGSFVVSAAGKFFKAWNKGRKLRRITHLDTPYLFLKEKPSIREVSPQDAKFVDAIHTNIGDCFPLNIGNDHNVGHVDFYPNGGAIQPSAYSYIKDSLLKADIFYASVCLYPPLCSHVQALQFFKVSINPPEGMYVGVRCKSFEDFMSGACKRCCAEDDSNCAVAGMDAEKFYRPSKRNRKNTKYYFNTCVECPFPEDFDFSISLHCNKTRRVK